MARSSLRVLFVGPDNATRSQFAEAIMRQAAGSSFEAVSAGTRPQPVARLTVQVLHEIGIDWSSARSKPLSDVADQPFDYVITMCPEVADAGRSVAAPHAELHWGFVDPSLIDGSPVERLAAFRRSRREVADEVLRFMERTLHAWRDERVPAAQHG